MTTGERSGIQRWLAGKPNLVRAIKAFLAVGIPAIACSLIYPKISPSWLAITLVVVISLVAIWAFWKVDVLGATKRELQLQQQVDDLVSKQVPDAIFEETVRYITDHVHKEIRRGRPEVQAILNYVTDAALQEIVQVLSRMFQDTVSLRIVFLEQIDPRHLHITRWYNPQKECPKSRTQNHHFQIADEHCSDDDITTAGVTWHQWKDKNGLPYVYIPSVPEHLQQILDHPELRRMFNHLHLQQRDRIKSILCLVVYHRPNDGPEEFHGIVCIDANIEHFFTTDRFERFTDAVRPFTRLIALAAKLSRAFSPTPPGTQMPLDGYHVDTRETGAPASDREHP